MRRRLQITIVFVSKFLECLAAYCLPCFQRGRSQTFIRSILEKLESISKMWKGVKVIDMQVFSGIN